MANPSNACVLGPRKKNTERKNQKSEPEGLSNDSFPGTLAGQTGPNPPRIGLLRFSRIDFSVLAGFSMDLHKDFDGFT